MAAWSDLDVHVASFPGLPCGGEEGLVHTACACVLISQHSRNSVARADFSVLVSSRLYIIQIRIPVYSRKTGRVPLCGHHALQCLQFSLKNKQEASLKSVLTERHFVLVTDWVL